MQQDEAASDCAATEQTPMTTDERLRSIARQAAELVELVGQYQDAPDGPKTIAAAFGVGNARHTKAEIQASMELIGRDISAHAKHL